MTGVLEVDNADRIVNLALIPDAMLGEFVIDGMGQYYRDKFGTPVIIADKFSIDRRYIKCAYSHKYKNLDLAIDQKALDDAKENALSLIKENAELKKNMDLKVERRIKGIEEGMREKVDEDLEGDNDDEIILTDEEVRNIVNE